MNVEQAIQARLKELCENKNMTAEELSARSRVDLETINQILNGEGEQTKYQTVVLLCEGLGIDLADFFQADVFRKQK